MGIYNISIEINRSNLIVIHIYYIQKTFAKVMCGGIIYYKDNNLNGFNILINYLHICYNFRLFNQWRKNYVKKL